MRSAWLICLVTGCGFSGPAASAADDQGTDPGSGDDSQTGSEPGPSASMCDVTDATLRLCLTFDQTPMMQDLATPPHTIRESLNVVAAQGLVTAAASTNTAAQFAQAHILFDNSTDFDLSALTIEMWMNPTKLKGPTTAGVLLDRNGQYTASIDANGAIRCTVGGQTAVSHDKIDSGWHHIACRYDPAASELRVYLDGGVDGCTVPPVAIQIGTATNLVIGAGHTGPAYQNPFSGMIDGVHLYARALGDAEICSAAGKAAGACSTSCQD